MPFRIRNFAVVLFALPLGACPGTPTNYRLTSEIGYAKTSAGYVNSGIWTKGHLYIWDRTSQTIKYLSEVDLTGADIARVETNGSMSASNLQGITVNAGAEVPTIVKATVQTALENNSSIELTNYATDGLKQPTATLIKYLRATLSSDRETQEAALLLKQAANSDRFRYLFTTRLIRADKADFKYNGSVKSGADVTIPIASLGGNVGANASATVTNQSMTQFNGKATAVLVDFTIYKLITITKDGNQFYSFEQDVTVPPNLSTELRKQI